MNNFKVISFVLYYFFVVKSLPYHAHSFNNVNIILQQLAKGTRSFKIDLSLVALETCREYGDRDDFILQEKKYNDIMGCIGLVGDKGSVPYVQEPFQTSDTFVEMFGKPKFIKIINQIQEPLWFELNFKSHEDISLTDHSILLVFLYRIIKVLDYYDGKILMGTSVCFPVLMEEYCRKQTEIDCNDIPIANMLRQTKKLKCENNLLLDSERVYFNIPVYDIDKYCQKGFEPFLEVKNQFTFWEPNTQSSIMGYINKLNNDCTKMQKHDYRITSNIDIDQFRILYNFKYRKDQQVYFMWQTQKGFEYVDFFYFEQYEFLVLIFQRLNTLILKTVKITNNSFKEIEHFEISKHQTLEDTLKKHKSSIIIYNPFQILQMKLDQYGNVDFKILKNLHDCKDILFDDNENIYCANWQYDKNMNIQLTINKYSNNKIENSSSSIFNMPKEIYQIIGIQQTLTQNNSVIVIQTINFDEDKTLKYFTYMFYLDIDKMTLSTFQNLDIKEQQFIITLNNTQIQYGTQFINNTDKNICSNKVRSNQKQTYRKNSTSHIGYYLGSLNDLKQLQNSKFVGYCDENIIHGSLGYSDQAKTRFVKIRNQLIPLVIHRNIDFSNLDVFSNFSGKIDNKNDVDKLSVFEIPVDEFIFQLIQPYNGISKKFQVNKKCQ